MTVESALVRATGASGAPFAVWLPKTPVENDVFVEVSASEMAEKVLAYEMGGLSISKLAEAYSVRRYAPGDHFAPPVSKTGRVCDRQGARGDGRGGARGDREVGP